MKDSSSRMERFLREYERSSGTNAEPTVGQFADVFLYAGPQGAQVVEAAAFRKAIPKRKKMLEEMGHRSTKLVSFCEERLDESYVMVKARWRFEFDGGEERGVPVETGSVFLVYTAGEEWRIVMYLAHEDVVAVMRERRSA